MLQPVPMEPAEPEPSFFIPTKYLELLTPPVFTMLKLLELRGAADVVASVHPVKPSSNPGLAMRLLLTMAYLALPTVMVSP